MRCLGGQTIKRLSHGSANTALATTSKVSRQSVTLYWYMQRVRDSKTTYYLEPKNRRLDIQTLTMIQEGLGRPLIISIRQHQKSGEIFVTTSSIQTLVP